MSGDNPAGPEAVLARAQERDLVWAAAAALGERDASLLDLHLRHGLEARELAEELQITPNAAHQALFRLRNRLGQAVRAWLLWHDDDPACVVLRAELAAAGQTAFGAATVRTVRRHVASCDLCAEEHDRVVAPAALFSAAPLVAAPAVLRTRALASLATADPPVADAGGADGAGGPEGGSDPTTARRVTSDGRVLAAGPPSVSRAAAAMGVVLVALVLLGGWLWWRTTAGPVAPTAIDQVASEAPADDPFDDTFVETIPVDVPTPAGQADAARPPAEVAPPVADPPPDAAPPMVPPPEPPVAPVEPEVPEVPVDPEVPAPRITSLSALYLGQCQTARSGLFEIVWASDDGETASLAGGGATEPVAASGAAQRCAPDGAAFTLNVAGPGGSATRSVNAAIP